MIDTHIHFDSPQYHDHAAICARAAQRGVQALIVPGVSPSSNLAVARLAATFPIVHAAAGLHPELPAIEEKDLDSLLATVRQHRSAICAIGEIGFPYYGPAASIPERHVLTRLIMERCASLAAELDLAVILHAPHQTAAPALRILRKAGVRRAVFHWHKSSEVTTKAIIDAGFFVSLTPEVVSRGRDRELARLAPLDQIVVETDGPYPYECSFPGMLTEPWMVSAAIDAIAEIKGKARDEIAAATSRNARRLFALQSI